MKSQLSIPKGEEIIRPNDEKIRQKYEDILKNKDVDRVAQLRRMIILEGLPEDSESEMDNRTSVPSLRARVWGLLLSVNKSQKNYYRPAPPPKNDDKKEIGQIDRDVKRSGLSEADGKLVTKLLKTLKEDLQIESQSFSLLAGELVKRLPELFAYNYLRSFLIMMNIEKWKSDLGINFELTMKVLTFFGVEISPKLMSQLTLELGSLLFHRRKDQDFVQWMDLLFAFGKMIVVPMLIARALTASRDSSSDQMSLNGIPVPFRVRENLDLALRIFQMMHFQELATVRSS